MAVSKPQKNGRGIAEKEIAEMVYLFDNVTEVKDWPGGKTETLIEFNGHLNQQAINYIRETQYELTYIHGNGDGAIVVEKPD